jgi:hypothetical protein
MDLAQRRLRNQYINSSPLEDPVEVVRALCAVQAQDYYASLWAVGLRLRGAHEADVERALNERRIVRTWPMRGTLHFIAAEDVRWLLALLAPRVLQRQTARLRREFAIDRPVLRRARKIVEKALCGGQAVTRSSLYQRFDAEGVSTERQRGLHILWWLAHEGQICCGPRAGKQPTFVLLDEWIPLSTAFNRDEALAKLAQRYFAHHGPATLADFVWWSGLTVADARRSIEAASSQLISETNDEVTWWSGAQRRTRRNPTCHLLPVYDEYTVGYADRSACLDPAQASRVAAGHGVFRAPIVINGRIVGSWSRELCKDRVDVRVTPLMRFNGEQMRSIEAAAGRYGEFLSVAAAVTRRR